MQTILSETNNKLLTQGELVANLKTQVENYQSIIEKKDAQMVEANKLLSYLTSYRKSLKSKLGQKNYTRLEQ